MSPKFILDLQDLDAAGKQFKTALSKTWLLGALEECEVTPGDHDGEVDIRYSRSGTDVILHGHVKAEVVLSCARCLSPVPQALRAELSLLLVPGGDPRGEFARGRKSQGKGSEYEFNPAEADMDVYNGEEVVLDPFLREALLLEIPPFPLCSEDCRGIAPPPAEESQGVGIDPRLAPLLKLKKQGN